MTSRSKSPLISVIIISYNMAREVPRTVQSFLPPYQEGILQDDIEIIVLENGSQHPISKNVISSWPENVRYINIENPIPSPSNALNYGVSISKGKLVCPVIDGARLVSPGIFKHTKNLVKIYDCPVIATVGYHLGHFVQQVNVTRGYNQEREDSLLEKIAWPKEPYRLFEISCLAGSSRKAWLRGISESNVLILKKEFYQQIGGYDERFTTPGGGIVNLEFFKRCTDHPDSQYILLMGEGSFHQYHGGVTTSKPVGTTIGKSGKTISEEYQEEYSDIFGRRFERTRVTPIIHGPLTQHVIRQILKISETEIENRSPKK